MHPKERYADLIAAEKLEELKMDEQRRQIERMLSGNRKPPEEEIIKELRRKSKCRNY